jgi:hypothetical protein
MLPEQGNPGVRLRRANLSQTLRWFGEPPPPRVLEDFVLLLSELF